MLSGSYKSHTSPHRRLPVIIATAVLVSGVLLLLHNIWASSEGYGVSYGSFGSSKHNDGWPKKLWYKLGPLGLYDEAQEWTDTCISLNPEHEVHFLTDDIGDEFVATAFASEPRLVEVYLNLTIPILKADILRLMLLYDQGGVYSDLDVSCHETPIDEWVPPEYKHNTSLVLGWEYDDIDSLPQLASWTMMAKPGSPHLKQVIVDAIGTIRELAWNKKVPVAELTKDMIGNVLFVTGPARVTVSVLKSLERQLDTTISKSQISYINEPTQVGDVLYLPGYMFAASEVQDKDRLLGPPLVTHHFKGSWTNALGGEKAPEKEE